MVISVGQSAVKESLISFADFMHSLLGEATDHISEASVSDLSKAMDRVRLLDTDLSL